MSTVDLSRLSTDFRKRYAGVRMQQGRVLTDDDFNDAQRLDAEDMRRTRVDVIGPVGSPDAGFLPVVAAALPLPGPVAFSLSAGNLYLGGLRIEQPADEAFNLQKDWLNFDAATDAPALPAAGSRIDLVWIEAWQQPVAAEEDSEKFEVALGSADTSVNVRTMRRVRVIPGVGTDDCAVAWNNALATWSAAEGTMQPDMEITTSAKLAVTFTVPPDPGDLCTPATAGGYLGAENQAIRVQMVDATHYTWGFDNAAPIYRVQVSEFLRNGLPVTQIKLLGQPKDSVHWPLKDQIVEVLPWSAALPNGETLAELGGRLARVTRTYNPDDQTLEIDTSMAGFGVQWKTRADVADFFDGTSEDDYYFLRVWNRGDDLASPASIPIANGDLGNTGLHVDFVGGPLRAQDFWIIAARPATPTVVVPWLLDAGTGGAPTHGVKRYRAPLGLIRWTVTGGAALGELIDDCRRPFLPLTKLRGCCTVTVGDGVTSFAMYTKIQAAIDALPASGGTVCVLPGTYNESVVISKRRDIVVHGCDARSRVRATSARVAGPAFFIVDSEDIAIERLGIEAGPRSAVEILRTRRAAVRQCVIQMRDLPTTFQAIWARGEDLVIERNLIDNLPRRDVAGGPDGGVLNSAFDGTSPPPPVVIASATRGGIQLGGGCRRVRILENVIRGGIWNGITLGSIIVEGGKDDQPDVPGAEDPCFPCRDVDSTGGGSIDPVRVRSAGHLYDIAIRGNTIEAMGANGISVVRFFGIGNSPLLIVVDGLHITSNLIHRCLRREIAPPPPALQWLVGYGGIALAVARDLRVCDNEITQNGASHLEPICGLFALAVENAQVDRNRIVDNGPRVREGNAGAKAGTRGGIWIWLALESGLGGAANTAALAVVKARLPSKLPAALVRDNIIVTPIGRPITLFAIGTVDVARNRLITQGTAGGGLDRLAAAVLIGNLGISNEWTLGLLFVFLLILVGAVPIGLDPCLLAKSLGLSNPQTGARWPPLTSRWPTGKVQFTENQVSCELEERRDGAIISSMLIASLDDVKFTDNQCEIETSAARFLTNAFLLGGSVRMADNRLSETWLRAILSGRSIGLMNTTTDNQSTHCLQADALAPTMRVFRDNLKFIQAFCPGECDRKFPPDKDPPGV